MRHFVTSFAYSLLTWLKKDMMEGIFFGLSNDEVWKRLKEAELELQGEAVCEAAVCVRYTSC